MIRYSCSKGNEAQLKTFKKSFKKLLTSLKLYDKIQLFQKNRGKKPLKKNKKKLLTNNNKRVKIKHVKHIENFKGFNRLETVMTDRKD